LGPGRRLRRLIGWSALCLSVLSVGLYGPDAWLAYQNRRLREMPLAALEKAVSEPGAGADAAYALGLRYVRENRLQDAVKAMLLANQKAPLRADILNDLGATYLVMDRYYECLVALQGAVLADPKFAPAHANLGRLHLSTRMPFTAMRDLETSVKLDSGSLAAWTDYGEAALRTLNYTTAEKAFRRALELKPDHVEALVGLGNTLFARARYPEAQEQIERALKLDAHHAGAMLARGRLLVNTASGPQDLAAAAEVFRAVTREHDAVADGWYELGRVTLQMRRAAEAVELLKEALRRNGDHPGAMNQMERALRAAGRTADADRTAAVFKQRSLREREETRLEEHIARHPDDWDARANLAAIYLETGKRGLALLVIKQLKDGKPDHRLLPALEAKLAGK
jgi:tetratricopeptide (TPR) repeat protein